jgi:hypothetical protein
MVLKNVPKIPRNFRRNDENLKKFLIFKKIAKLDLLASNP